MMLKKPNKLRSWNSKSNRINNPYPRFGFFIFITALLLTACGGQVARNPANPFIVPSLVPQSSPVIVETPTGTVIENTAVPDCTDDLVFIDDVTIPDGTTFGPGAQIDKSWLVSNAGTCNWGNGYTLRLSAGPNMGASAEHALVPARSGSETEIGITFTAPTAPGDYLSKWQAFNPAGEPFGEEFFIDITVDLSLAPPPSPTTGES
ncbi:MAG: hypothetical protein FVQ83_10235 [Chloroflexi bacterium]|nr:hypothetical protein [Chloroflexota bacterium]